MASDTLALLFSSLAIPAFFQALLGCYWVYLALGAIEASEEEESIQQPFLRSYQPT